MIKPIALSALAATFLALAALPALAQYKVVRPDGSVTYTDRPPTDGNARVIQLGRNGEAAEPAPQLELPLELRRAVSRYPVTLYTSADCSPCDSGRRLLQQRGVPYTERRIATEEDAQALERVAGGRSVPALSIGAQPVRGFSAGEWQAYLDAAGYPRESKLPANWPQPAPTPLVERTLVVPPARQAPPPARTAAPVEIPASGGLRF